MTSLARTEPAFFRAAVALGLVGVLLVAVATLIKAPAAVAAAGLVSTIAAPGLVAFALAEPPASRVRPVISAAWRMDGGQLFLAGTVTATGLRAGDQLTVAAAAVGPDTTAPSSGVGVGRVTDARYDHLPYLQTAGSDAEGEVRLTFDIPLPQGGTGMQVVASTIGLLLCAAETSPPNSGDGRVVPLVDHACLTVDAPGDREPTPPVEPSPSAEP